MIQSTKHKMPSRCFLLSLISQLVYFVVSSYWLPHLQSRYFIVSRLSFHGKFERKKKNETNSDAGIVSDNILVLKRLSWSSSLCSSFARYLLLLSTKLLKNQLAKFRHRHRDKTISAELRHSKLYVKDLSESIQVKTFLTTMQLQFCNSHINPRDIEEEEENVIAHANAKGKESGKQIKWTPWMKLNNHRFTIFEVPQRRWFMILK